MKKIIFLFFITYIAYSQQINIYGRITNSGKQAVSGAIVNLFNQSLACTSKADGSYLLLGNTKIFSDKLSGKTSIYKIKYKNGIFIINAQKSLYLQIKLYNISGRLINVVFNGLLKQNQNNIPLCLNDYNNNVYFVKFTTENSEKTFTLIPHLETTFILSDSFNNTTKLPKISQIDWLQVYKRGYSTHIQPVDSYIDSINIVLENLPSSSPDFGSNVKIFDPSMPMNLIQGTMNSYSSSTSEFTTQRVAYLFKPGQYNLTININYYIQALGLGMLPDNVTITGAVESRGTRSLGYFWRGAENMCVVPTGQANIWAVSQAAPFRRMHIKGDINLADGGSTSGGWFSDCKIDGFVNSLSQQQWYSRNTIIGGWNGGVWNMFFHGVIGAPSQNWPTLPYTVVPLVPVIREKPFLIIDDGGYYYVYVPSLRTNSYGTTWYNAIPNGEMLPLDQFYIVKEGTDNDLSINNALSQGKNLLITPGIYKINNPIEIRRPNTVVLGIGFPSFVAQNGCIALKVADVDGVKIGGLLFDASGVNESPCLIEVGEQESKTDHSKNPTFLWDIFCRIGGYLAGKVSSNIVINSNNVIIDHCWIWRADHGNGVGWNINTSKNGIIINGNDVTIYGQFVEHHQQYQTIWRGERGRNYFYQCEMPYDVPSQEAFNHDSINGWASYKIGDSVTTHEAWGTGIYAFFNKQPIKVDNAIHTPKSPNIKFYHLVTISLGGNLGEISHVINGYGDAANNTNTKVFLDEYIALR